ncbi:MAG: hypothetical protein ACO3UU_03140 [Minisyncoccia bacterium]
MSNKIKNFLYKNIASSVFYTHVSMIDPVGKYGLNRENFDEFWELYNNALWENGDDLIIGIGRNPTVDTENKNRNLCISKNKINGFHGEINCTITRELSRYGV